MSGAGIHNEQVAYAVYRYATRISQVRGCSLPAVSREAALAIPRHGGDNPARGDLADALVVWQVHVAGPVHRHVAWTVHLRVQGRSAVSRGAAHAIARDCGDDP